MKQFLILFLLFFTSHISAQVKPAPVKAIDKKAFQIDRVAINVKKLEVDSSMLEDSYIERFLIDSVTRKLVKVRCEHFNPYINTMYFFENEKLVRVYVGDKSGRISHEGIIMESYYKDGKLLYKNYDKILDYNDPKYLLAEANKYLLRFYKASPVKTNH